MKYFEYQLINWQKHEVDLKPFLEPFKIHNEMDKVKVVKSREGYSLFTSGKLIINPMDYRGKKIEA